MSTQSNSPLPTSDQIRAARAWLRLTQGEFADATGVPKRTLARIEVDDCAPYAETLAGIAVALDGLGVSLLFEKGRAVGIKVRAPRPGRRPRRVMTKRQEPA